MQILSNKNLFGLIFLILALSQAVNAAGPAAVNLGSAGNFVILAKSGVSTTGTTSIVGDIGASPIDHTAITGFGLSLDPSGQFATSSLVTGKLYASDYSPPTPTTMTTAISDMQTAYTDAAGRTSPTATELGAGNIGGLTLAPGLYKWGTGVTIPTDVTLNGSATDVWIFQIAQTLDISSGKKVLLSGGAQASNIFWQVAGQTTLGTTSVFNGIILGQTAIVLNNGATLNGRALAQTAVTMDANIVSAAVSSANSTAPTITLNAPGNGQGASTSSKNVTFNWTATDPLYLNLTCNFSVDGAVNRSNLAAVNNTPFTTSAVVNLSEGVHTWAVSCWDLSNNTTSSATNHFAVDLTKPAVVANAPVANANVSTSTTTFRWNATDLLSIMTCNLTIDGAVSQSSIAANNSTLTTATAPLANGIHTWNVSCTDSAGNTNNSMAASQFTVDATAPVVTLSGPVDNLQTNSSSFVFNFTTTDNSASTTSCSLYMNSVLSQTNASTKNNTLTAFTNATVLDGSYTWYVGCTDFAGNIGNSSTRGFLVDASGTSVLLNTTTNVTANQTQVVLVPTSPAGTISMSSNATNVTLSLAASLNGSSNSSTITNALNVTANTSFGNVLLQFPAGIVITGPAGWNGLLNLPYTMPQATYNATPDPGYSATTVAVFSMGIDGNMTFSKGVRVLLPGMAGYFVGFVKNGTFTKITNACANDSQTTGDALAAGSECRIDVGSDMVIWTKHFADFVTYTQAWVPVNPSGGGSSGGGSGGSGSGSGGSGSHTAAGSNQGSGTAMLGTTPVPYTRTVSVSMQNTTTVTLTITDNTSAPLNNFEIVDTMPASFTSNAGDISYNIAPASQTSNPVVATWKFSVLNPSESLVLIYSINAASPAKSDDFSVSFVQLQANSSMPINRLTTGTLSVPATVNAGDTVTFILTGANGAPIANEAVTVTNPSRMTTDYTTNASGQASFVASAEGQYNYMVAGMVLNKSVSTSANALVKPGTGGTQPPAANQSGGTPVAPVPTTDFGPLGILLLAAIAIVVIVGGYLVFVKSMKQKKSDDEDSQNNRKKQSGK